MLVVTKFNKNIDAVLPIVLLSSKCPLERYTHTAYLINKNVEPLLIKERLGHKDIRITLNTYGHLYPNKAKSVADLLDANRG